mmetsp:Transcript_100591/g.300142  ORF Transcript_100591/g.300142 Transcript_100591/m.300142 type:complete len:275 (+) Transcript_100591:171-995(+)
MWKQGSVRTFCPTSMSSRQMVHLSSVGACSLPATAYEHTSCRQLLPRRRLLLLLGTAVGTGVCKACWARACSRVKRASVSATAARAATTAKAPLLAAASELGGRELARTAERSCAMPEKCTDRLEMSAASCPVTGNSGCADGWWRLPPNPLCAGTASGGTGSTKDSPAKVARLGKPSSAKASSEIRSCMPMCSSHTSCPAKCDVALDREAYPVSERAGSETLIGGPSDRSAGIPPWAKLVKPVVGGNTPGSALLWPTPIEGGLTSCGASAPAAG